MAKCKNCTNLHEHWCEKIVDSPCEDTERECDQYKCMTQAERIRSMTDEELAEWFSTVTDDVLRGSTWSKDGWMKYLQSEVEYFDEEIMENLQYDPFESVTGLIALFYRNLWAMADLRETLKSYEDAKDKIESRINDIKNSSDFPHNFKGQMVENLEWVLKQLN